MERKAVGETRVDPHLRSMGRVLLTWAALDQARGLFDKCQDPNGDDCPEWLAVTSGRWKRCAGAALRCSEGCTGAVPAPCCPGLPVLLISSLSLGHQQPCSGGGMVLCSCPASFLLPCAIAVVQVSPQGAVLWHGCSPEVPWSAGAQLALIYSSTLLLQTYSHYFLADPQDLI